MYQNGFKHITILFFIVMVGGILSGIVAWLFLPDAMTDTLRQYIYTQLMDFDQTPTIKENFKLVAETNAIDMLRIFLCGVCLIGLPLLMIYLFVKCFSIGFVMIVLLQHSVFLCFSRVLYLPILLCATILACRFSLQMVQGRLTNPFGPLLQYTLLFLFVVLVMVLVSFLDGLSNYFYLKGLV